MYYMYVIVRIINALYPCVVFSVNMIVYIRGPSHFNEHLSIRLLWQWDVSLCSTVCKLITVFVLNANYTYVHMHPFRFSLLRIYVQRFPMYMYMFKRINNIYRQVDRIVLNQPITCRFLIARVIVIKDRKNIYNYVQ